MFQLENLMNGHSVTGPAILVDNLRFVYLCTCYSYVMDIIMTTKWDKQRITYTHYTCTFGGKQSTLSARVRVECVAGEMTSKGVSIMVDKMHYGV